MCITEAKISNKNKNFFYHKEYNTFHNLPANHENLSPKEGIMILIHNNLSKDPPIIIDLTPGRATSIEFYIESKTFKCYCLYAPSQGDAVSQTFYKDLFNKHPPEPTHNNIFIGDFNVVQSPNLDRRNTNITYHKPHTSKLLNNLMLDHALVDPWRTTNPQLKEFSWDNKTSA